MPRIRYRKCWMNFSKGEFNCDGSGPLSQPQVNSVYCSLPATGAAWVEGGKLFVQQSDNGKAFDLGPVKPGVKIQRVRCTTLTRR